METIEEVLCRVEKIGIGGRFNLSLPVKGF